MVPSCLRPHPARAALAAAALAAALVSPSYASAGKAPARAAALIPAQLELAGKERARYGRAVTLTATLTAAGKPLGGREVALYLDGAQVATAVTKASGKATFKQKASRTGSFDARFTPVEPADLAAYQAGASQPLRLEVVPILRLAPSSPLKVGRKAVGIPGESVRVRGTILPYEAGTVKVRVTAGGRELDSDSRPVIRKGSRGRFNFTLTTGRRGEITLSAVREADAGLGRGKASKTLLLVRGSAGLGSRGPAVRALQGRLNALGYLSPVNGHFGATTARAVLAFRKANGMSRSFFAGHAVFRRLQRGGGGFRVRYPKAGKHVEFDWSRQVLVLARGARVVRVLHASSGAPVTPTVFGSFRFYRKSPGYNSKGMYFSSYFIGGYAIHGFASVPNFPASHGCIRIPIPSAQAVFRWVKLGDRISVYR